MPAGQLGLQSLQEDSVPQFVLGKWPAAALFRHSAKSPGTLRSGTLIRRVSPAWPGIHRGGDIAVLASVPGVRHEGRPHQGQGRKGKRRVVVRRAWLALHCGPPVSPRGLLSAVSPAVALGPASPSLTRTSVNDLGLSLQHKVQGQVDTRITQDRSSRQIASIAVLRGCLVNSARRKGHTTCVV